MQDQGTLPLKTPPRHRNITVKRLLFDAYQFVRAQTFISKRFGSQFLPSREYAEIDITYKCNLKCLNCNRSCTQAPSNLEIPLAAIEAFINQGIKNNIAWKRIRYFFGPDVCLLQIMRSFWLPVADKNIQTIENLAYGLQAD